MPDYAVLQLDILPAIGSDKQCRVYRGTHADEQAANDAAALLWGVDTGARCWVVLGTDLHRYTNTKTVSYSSLLG